MITVGVHSPQTPRPEFTSSSLLANPNLLICCYFLLLLLLLSTNPQIQRVRFDRSHYYHAHAQHLILLLLLLLLTLPILICSSPSKINQSINQCPKRPRHDLRARRLSVQEVHQRRSPRKERRRGRKGEGKEEEEEDEGEGEQRKKVRHAGRAQCTEPGEFAALCRRPQAPLARSQT